jgi:hypothetical protein
MVHSRFAGSILSIALTFGVFFCGCGGGDDNGGGDEQQNTPSPSGSLTLSGTWHFSFSSGTQVDVALVQTGDSVVSTSPTMPNGRHMEGKLQGLNIDISVTPVTGIPETKLTGTVAADGNSMVGTGKQPPDGSGWSGTWTAIRLR